MECPICGRRLRVDERLVGRRVKCPECKSAITVEEPSAEYERLDDYVEEPRRATRSSAERTTKAGSLTCPMCGAQNHAAAEECRECGESFSTNPLDSAVEAWRDGKLLVTPKLAVLPNRCLKTNEPATTKLYQKFSWHPAWIYVLVGCGGLVYVIVALLIREQGELELPLGDRARQRRMWAHIVAWALGLGGFGIMVLGIVMRTNADIHNRNNIERGDMLGMMLGIGFLIALFGPIIGVIAGNLVTAKRITRDYIWLKGVHPDYLAKLPKWPGE
jgi:predicted RNA-binding Zn-ribbon protein involved in translation (DUF1610 family)